MRAVIVPEPNKVEVVDIPKPTPSPYQALVRTKVACLCNATDAKLISGHFPGVTEYPLALGHEAAGIVEEVGTKVTTFKVGDHAIGGLVFSFEDEKINTGWGGFCEYTLVTDHDAMVADGVANEEHGWFEAAEIQRPVADDIPWAEAAMLCTWREVYAGFSDFALTEGQDILICGAGPVGLSFTKFGRLLGLGKIGVVDPLQWKQEKAREMGADFATVPGMEEIEDLAGKLDAVIDAVGHPAIINESLGLVKMGGSICVYGVVGDDEFTLKKCNGPYNFNLLFHQWPTRHFERAAQEPLCDWIREGKLTASEFISHEFPIEQFEEGLTRVSEGKAVKILFNY